MVKGTITVPSTAVADADSDNRNKEVILKGCAPFTHCIRHAKEIDVVLPMYNLVEYSDNYLKLSASLWQCCRDKPALNKLIFLQLKFRNIFSYNLNKLIMIVLRLNLNKNSSLNRKL